MTTFTLSVQDSVINIDSLANKTTGDAYNISNNATLVIDQDSRYGFNQSVSSTLGTITINQSTGGNVFIDATKVRLVPFDSGAGTVPVCNTSITASNGGAAGRLIGVYTSVTSAPLLTGSAMPVTGILKLKGWNDLPFASGSLAGTNLTASCSGPDRAGWIDVVGAELGNMSIPRLGLFKVTGSWYEVGTCTGDRSSSYQLPTNGNATWVPGVWVETSASSNAYEFYALATGITASVTAIGTERDRGKFCWLSSGSNFNGLLWFGNDALGNTSGGYVPLSGSRIRVPNVFLQNATTTTPWNNTVPNALVTTRYDFTTTTAGNLDISNASMSWYVGWTQPYSVRMKDMSLFIPFSVTEVPTPMSWSNVGASSPERRSVQSGFTLCKAGTLIEDSVFVCAQLPANTVNVAFTDCDNVTINRTTFQVVDRLVASINLYLLRTNNVTIVSSTIIADGTTFSSQDTSYVKDMTYIDRTAGRTIVSPAVNGVTYSNAYHGLLDGFLTGTIAQCVPFIALVLVGAGCSDISIRNIGSYDEPLNLGGETVMDAPWSRVGTVCTVTSSMHGFAVGDYFATSISSELGSITVGGSKVITGVPTSDTFTFTVTNAGATTGLLTYTRVYSGYGINIATAAGDRTTLKRIYIKNARINSVAHDNSQYDLLRESFHGDMIYDSLFVSNNELAKGVAAQSLITPQASVYGTHWVDAFIGEPNYPAGSACPWSRVSTSFFVTASAGYNLRNYANTSQLITVTSSSNTTTPPQVRTLATFPSSSIFSFVGLNSGPTTGTLTFEQHSSFISILSNEPTAKTQDQVTLNGSPLPTFTSAGTIYMPTIGQSVMWTCPYYVVGHTGFMPLQLTMGGATLTNYHLTYAIDKNDGLGFGNETLSGSWKSLNYPRAGGAGVQGSTTVTMTSTDGVNVGDYIFGANILPKTQVVSINSATAITVSQPNWGTFSGILSFSALPNETVSSSDGFKLRVHCRTVVTNTQAMGNIRIWTYSTHESRRAALYPLDLIPVVVNNLKNPSEVRIFEAGTTNELAGEENVTNGTFTASIDVARYPYVDVSILSLGYQNLRFTNQSVADGVEILASQVIDRQYQNP